MRRYLFFFSLVFIYFIGNHANAQNQINFLSTRTVVTTSPTQSFVDKASSGMNISWRFPSANSFDVNVNNTIYQRIAIEDFTHLKEVGKPALPCHSELVVIPDGATARIEITNAKYSTQKGYNVHPALQPASDEYGAPEPDFEIDQQFYSSDLIYPESPVQITNILIYKGVRIAVLQVNPVQYNPKKRELRTYFELDFTVHFDGASSEFLLNKENFSNHALELIPLGMLNSESLLAEVESYTPSIKAVSGPAKNYIIITTDDLKDAADSMAMWKRQLGYTVEVVTEPSWTSTEVSNAVSDRYDNWTPKPDFVLFIGDHDRVPGEELVNSSSATFATDLYYVCMDGSNDHTPDMAKGRISVTSAAQANQVVTKVINYERFPTSNVSSYTTSTCAAYFQESATLGYAERRFAQTAEDIKGYVDDTLTAYNYSVERIYVTGSSTTPTNWNNGNYSNGEALPSYLLKPTFAWDGDNTDINASINAGRMFVFHRDHGYTGGWGDPSYSSTDLNGLSNGDKLPIIFSINCLTGKFYETECFSEKFLRMNNAGTAGIFCHAEVSYSGYNDGLSLGLIDAIWGNPGYIPTFTGSGNNPTGTPQAHADIHTLGDVANQALLRMIRTWGDNEYTHQLFHYFGDPAMKIWVSQPSAITATHQTTIMCNTNTFTINTSSQSDALATLVIDGELYGSVNLVNGSGIITGVPIVGSTAIITISKDGYQSYFDYIQIQGNCPKAKFNISYTNLCIDEQITFTDQSIATGLSYSWDFGVGASTQTATTVGPHNITYATGGMKVISLTVTNSMGTSTYTDSIDMPNVCTFNMTSSGHDTITNCTGILFDDGGASGNYSDDSDLLTTIAPPGASQVTINFVSFDVEAGSGTTCDYDRLLIYDGPDALSTLLGTWCNTTGSPGLITSTGSSLTVRLYSDANTNNAGFEASFNCVIANVPPVAGFTANTTQTCTGLISFTDNSTNLPIAWHWDFGDGDTSNLQNPNHVYNTQGVYTVSLIATNLYGSDTMIQTNYITVTLPNPPTVSQVNGCTPNIYTINATYSGGAVNWYDSINAVTPIYTGNPFVTPLLSNSTTYYVEGETYQTVPDTVFGAKTDNSGGGGYYTNTATHYLEFDAYSDFTLLSTKVYAQGAGNRTINVRNSGGNIINTSTVNIPDGESRITLNFAITQGNDYTIEVSGTPDLYRNNSGLTYPYTTPGVYSITNSSAGASTSYYYYFYDWETSYDRIDTCSSTRVAADVVIEVDTVNITPDTVVCLGSSINLALSGGYNYNWSTGATTSNINVSPLTFTNYTVTYTQGLCTYTKSVNVSVLLPVTASITGDHNICSNEITTLVASGATYYTWSDGSTNDSLVINPNTTTTYTVTVSNGACTDVSSFIVNVEAAPTTTAGVDQTICSGSSIVLTATGASTYSWSNGSSTASTTVSPTSTQTYVVLGYSASGNCSAVDDIIVNVENLPIANAGPNITICEGDTALLFASGGYDYLWNTGDTTQLISINPVITTTYTISVSSVACSATTQDDVVVSVNPAPSLILNGLTDICFGNSVTIVANGIGNFLWSTGAITSSITITPTATTTIWCTLSGPLCSTTDYHTITVSPLPNATIIEGNNVSICPGDQQVLTASPSGMAYLWNNGAITQSITVNNAGNYWVEVSSPIGCTDVSDTTFVTLLSPAPIADFTKNVYDPSVQFTNASMYDNSNIWYFGDGVSSIQSDPNHTYVYNGTYNIMLTVENQCGADTLIDTVYIYHASQDLTEIDGLFDINVWPNPTVKDLSLEFNSDKNQTVVISLIDQLGRAVWIDEKTILSGNNIIQIDISRYAAGMYSLNIATENAISTRKIIKR